MFSADDHSDNPFSGTPPAAPDGPAAILGRISDGLLALDTGGRITYLNETAAQVFGRRREDLAGGRSRLDALVTAVDAKDRYTRRHSEDVMTRGLEIARRLGLTGTRSPWPPCGTTSARSASRTKSSASRGT